MLRFHRTTYQHGDAPYATSWWQLGDRIWRHRVRAL
jgi:hypothetical protein